MLAICARRAITPLQTISPATLLVENGTIVAVGSPTQVPVPGGAAVIDVGDRTVAPGFIDTHIHGRDGACFGEDADTAAALCRSAASTGVTGLLPTLSSLLPVQYTLEMILERIRTVRRVMTQATPLRPLAPPCEDRGPPKTGDYRRQGTTAGGAEILGIHMEGPYLSGDGSAIGAQLAQNLRRPSVEELHRMVEASAGTIRKMSIAPELDGALDMIREMDRLGIVPCAAHSTASYEQAMAAVQAGLCCATHVFNGMSLFHHRKPGLVGAILCSDRIHAELIADGQHVSAPAMQVLLRCKGVDGIHLVTDNTLWAGMPNGTYRDGERTIVKEDERVSVAGGTLIGSVAPMNRCVRNMVLMVGCLLAEAVQMATLNPARLIGVDDRKGSLEVGKDADLVVIDDDINVHMTMVRGREVYRAG